MAISSIISKSSCELGNQEWLTWEVLPRVSWICRYDTGQGCSHQRLDRGWRSGSQRHLLMAGKFRQLSAGGHSSTSQESVHQLCLSPQRGHWLRPPWVTPDSEVEATEPLWLRLSRPTIHSDTCPLLEVSHWLSPHSRRGEFGWTFWSEKYQRVSGLISRPLHFKMLAPSSDREGGVTHSRTGQATSPKAGSHSWHCSGLYMKKTIWHEFMTSLHFPFRENDFHATAEKRHVINVITAWTYSLCRKLTECQIRDRSLAISCQYHQLDWWMNQTMKSSRIVSVLVCKLNQVRATHK